MTLSLRGLVVLTNKTQGIRSQMFCAQSLLQWLLITEVVSFGAWVALKDDI